MGDDRIEELARTLAGPVSRRRALKTFAAAAAVGVVSLVGPAQASAGRCRKLGHKCRQNYECCSFYCNPASARCECPPGSNLCEKTAQCVHCPANSTFDSATCTCTCNEGTTPCGTQCCAPGHECCPGGYYGPFCSYYSTC